MPQSRQLASIMFTDIVGYTALMGNDERNALDLLDKNRQMQQPIIFQFGGKWIKEIGDGILASFNTVADAVNAAIKIQERCNEEKSFQLRIGIHLGDVIFENEDVFGDGVNIASRIQSLADPGAIYVSESVYQIIANKREINTRFVKEEMLRNVKDAVRIYEIITSSSGTHRTLPVEKVTKIASEKSIAVLPFVNMSNDPDQEYFSDGMAEEILNSLSHLKELKVAGRTSSFQFKGKDIDLREVGQKLQVRTVLEGSVRRQNNRLRITAQLINVEDGYHLWSAKYDRDMDDIFAIQDEIALTITEQLKLTILSKERETITKVSTESSQAHELYLKGRFYLNRRGNSVLAGLDCFKQAIAIDPKYAGAHSGFADASSLSAVYSFQPGNAVMNDVKEAAETALSLDSTLCEAYLALGIYYCTYAWNWVEAKKNFIKSIELNPNYAIGHSIYGMAFLCFIEGNFVEAENQGRIAIKLEPLSAIDHADLAWVLHTAGKFEEALSMAKIGIELDGNSFLSHRLAGLVYLGMERYQEAIDTFQSLVKMSNGHQQVINSLIWAYCGMGNLQEARILMDELLRRSSNEYIAGTFLGVSAAWMGNLDNAMNYLEKAFLDRDPMLNQLRYSLIVPPILKADKRFQDLLVRIGFPR
jgi:adenylate cyclase